MPDKVDRLDIDNTRVREQQVARLKTIRLTRDQPRVQAALDALTAAATSGAGNLLALAVEASRARATVGEISDALEKVYGRHAATIRTISGVYSAEAHAGGEVSAPTGGFDLEHQDHISFAVPNAGMTWSGRSRYRCSG